MDNLGKERRQSHTEEGHARLAVQADSLRGRLYVSLHQSSVASDRVRHADGDI